MTPHRRSLLAGAAVAAVSLGASRVFSQAPSAAAETDHRRLLDMLGIETLRPGADGWTPDAPNPPNYDEARAGGFSRLPNPLRFEDGREVASAADWPARRAEIADLFEGEIYGRVPANAPRVAWQAGPERAGMIEGLATTSRTLTGRMARGGPVIEATLTVPEDVEGPVPAVIALSFPAAVMARFPPEPGRSWKARVLERGWAAVEYVPTSVQADNGEGLTSGVIGLTTRPRGLEDWGALRAWAWGASRVLDALEADPAVDAQRVMLYGVSRYGKAALVAQGFDTRFAAGFVASSGAGGAKLLRRDYGERVENLASSGLYHWMAGNFLKYAGPLTANDLPVDAHQLIALCAPRPVFISVGSFDADRWTDPRGMFMAAAAASPVYGLLGARPLESAAWPPIETLVNGDVAFRQHSGGHTGGPNWPYVLDWVEPRLRRA